MVNVRRRNRPFETPSTLVASTSRKFRGSWHRRRWRRLRCWCFYDSRLSPDRLDTERRSVCHLNTWSAISVIQGLRDSFPAASKLNFVSKYSFESSPRDLQDLHVFAPLSIQNFSQISSKILAVSYFYFQKVLEFWFFPKRFQKIF